jgi:hypothetical protein
MPARRINDAQIERLLAALQSLSYRQELAEHIAEREGIKYASAMRRLQRYITESTEKRSFARSPVPQQKILRQEARRVPLPPDLPPVPRRPPPEREPSHGPTFDELTDYQYADRPPLPELTEDEIERQRELQERWAAERATGSDLTNADYEAIVAYYDGDTEEAVKALGFEGMEAERIHALLELTLQGFDTVDMSPIAGKMFDAGEALKEAAADLLQRDLPEADSQDIQDLSDLFNNLPQWQTEMIVQDIRDGKTTFADWLDAWRDDGMDLDVDDSAFWEVWREAYGRSKG